MKRAEKDKGDGKRRERCSEEEAYRVAQDLYKAAKAFNAYYERCHRRRRRSGGDR